MEMRVCKIFEYLIETRRKNLNRMLHASVQIAIFSVERKFGAIGDARHAKPISERVCWNIDRIYSIRPIKRLVQVRCFTRFNYGFIFI